MNLQTAKIISAPSKSCWSQVYIDGDFFVVIKIEEETDPSSKAKEIISCFHKDYTSSEGGVLKKLETSLAKIQEEGVEIITGVVWNDILYLGILNKGRAVLLREGKLVTILEGKEGKEGVITASGFWQENDLFVLGTERFFELIPEEILKANLENKDPEEVVEVLAPIIHGSEEDGGMAGVVLKFKMGDSSGMKNEKLKIKEKLTQFFQKISSRPRAIYIPRKQKTETKEQRTMMTIAIVLAGLLLVSVVFGWQKKRREEETRRFNQFWEEIEYKYEEGKKVVELNPLLARELLGRSLELAKEKKNDYLAKSWQYKKLTKVEKEIEEELEKVLREYELAETPVFLDLNLITKDLKGIDLDFWEEEIVVLGGDGTVVKIDLNRKSNILGKVEGGKLVTLWGERAFVLGEKIVEIGNKTEIEKGWDEVVALQVFAGNLYLLDKGENNIWKYPAIEEGFGAKRSWLGSGVEPDLAEAIDMTIDGDIWILKETGEILKFSRGAPKTFGISGLEQEFHHPLAFYTDEDCKKIYVLDKGNERIVALHKSGEYDSQYIWEGIKDVDDIVVSEEEGKMFLLSEEKIFEIEIKGRS